MRYGKEEKKTTRKRKEEIKGSMKKRKDRRDGKE